jgi:hypothetical protein
MAPACSERAAVVSEYLASSPVVARPWCPGCEPLTDPTLEILDVRYCDQHVAEQAGSDDGRVMADGYLSGNAEAGGDANRLWCQLFHRQLRERAVEVVADLRDPFPALPC